MIFHALSILVAGLIFVWFVGQQALNGPQYRLQTLCRRPLFTWTLSMPCSQDGQTHLAASIDVGIESSAPSVGRLGFDFGRFAGVLCTEVDVELEEAVLVRGAMGPDDQSSDMADVLLLAGHSNSYVKR